MSINEDKQQDNSTEELLTYVAHYSSPRNSNPVKGFFEFESFHRASSKQNIQDARIKMLEIFGKDAVSWMIDKVKVKKQNDRICSDQMELDFREQKPSTKRQRNRKGFKY